MKPTITLGTARGVQLCSGADLEAAADKKVRAPGITIAGEMFVPDAATAYVEFFLGHAFPVWLDVAEPGCEPYRTTIHPQTVANSYRSLRGKVLNFAHIMRSYDPEKNVRDRMSGTVMAAELSGIRGRRGAVRNRRGACAPRGRMEGAGRPVAGAGNPGGGGAP